VRVAVMGKPPFECAPVIGKGGAEINRYAKVYRQ